LLFDLADDVAAAADKVVNSTPVDLRLWRCSTRLGSGWSAA
jgi:hypothetical protein